MRQEAERLERKQARQVAEAKKQDELRRMAT